MRDYGNLDLPYAHRCFTDAYILYFFAVSAVSVILYTKSSTINLDYQLPTTKVPWPVYMREFRSFD